MSYELNLDPLKNCHYHSQPLNIYFFLVEYSKLKLFLFIKVPDEQEKYLKHFHAR